MTDKEKLKRVLELQHGNGEHVNGLHIGLQLLRDLLTLKADVKKRVEIQPMTDGQVKKRLTKGAPLVSRKELAIHLRRFVQHWHDVGGIFRSHALLRVEVTDPEYYLQEFIDGGGGLADMVERHGENGALLHYMLLEVFKPVYESYGEAYGKQFDDATWVQPFCYVCGGAPDMAMLAGDGGKRYLCCRLCDTSWWYAKLKCPHCGNEDLEKLVSLSLEQESSYLIHACKACNRYLKVVDARIQNGDALFLELEDLKTSYLDGVAQREGFTPR